MTEQEWAKPYTAARGIECRSVMTVAPDDQGIVEIQVQFLEALLEDAGWRRVWKKPAEPAPPALGAVGSRIDPTNINGSGIR